uniref:NADH-ubiquinone oxidoreductase chain 6 n=1 Tax=Trigonopterus sp. 2 AH-2016 TaxID=1903836 RepID=A0A343C3Z5_9CUCU|nr:NADH dehydrogenase subunit 6 [Trigonopterus sp. 2 AH-2016]
MLTSILFTNWAFSLIFMYLNHPMSLGAVLLIQTFLIALASGFLYLNFWFSYILFLVMIGGMLVLFIYMTSIASNEKFNMPKHFLSIFTLSLVTFLILMLLPDNPLFFSHSTESLSINQTFKLTSLSMSKYFNFPSMLGLMMLMAYLLVTLIAIVKVTDKTLGTLRQK